MGFLDRRLSSRARARVDTRARGDDRRAAVKRERATGIPVVSRARSGRDARATEPVVVELAAVVVVVSSVVVSSVVEGLGAMRMRA